MMNSDRKNPSQLASRIIWSAMLMLVVVAVLVLLEDMATNSTHSFWTTFISSRWEDTDTTMELRPSLTFRISSMDSSSYNNEEEGTSMTVGTRTTTITTKAATSQDVNTQDRDIEEDIVNLVLYQELNTSVPSKEQTTTTPRGGNTTLPIVDKSNKESTFSSSVSLESRTLNQDGFDSSVNNTNSTPIVGHLALNLTADAELMEHPNDEIAVLEAVIQSTYNDLECQERLVTNVSVITNTTLYLQQMAQRQDGSDHLTMDDANHRRRRLLDAMQKEILLTIATVTHHSTRTLQGGLAPSPVPSNNNTQGTANNNNTAATGSSTSVIRPFNFLVVISGECRGCESEESESLFDEVTDDTLRRQKRQLHQVAQAPHEQEDGDLPGSTVLTRTEYHHHIASPQQQFQRNLQCDHPTQSNFASTLMEQVGDEIDNGRFQLIRSIERVTELLVHNDLCDNAEEISDEEDFASQVVIRFGPTTNSITRNGRSIQDICTYLSDAVFETYNTNNFFHPDRCDPTKRQLQQVGVSFATGNDSIGCSTIPIDETVTIVFDTIQLKLVGTCYDCHQNSFDEDNAGRKKRSWERQLQSHRYEDDFDETALLLPCQTLCPQQAIADPSDQRDITKEEYEFELLQELQYWWDDRQITL